jgi:hypothetical protein
VRTGGILRIVAAASIAWLMLPATASAFPLSGSCALTLTSTDAKGATLDTAKSGDGSASESDPLLVDWDGTLTWSGTSTIALQDNSYHVEMFGLPTPFRGSSANTGDARASSGTFAFKANAPIRFTGAYYLTAGIKGSGGTCEGSLVVKLIGDPITTIPFLVALALMAIGGLLAAWGLSGHLLGALAGGPILGFGAGLLAVILSVLPAGGLTPLILLAAGLVTGGATGVAGRAKTWVRPAAAPTTTPSDATPSDHTSPDDTPPDDAPLLATGVAAPPTDDTPPDDTPPDATLPTAMAPAATRSQDTPPDDIQPASA